MQLDQDLDWGLVSEQKTNSEEANKMLSRPMREPWGSIYR
jgi:hypothetical protein